LRNRREYFSRLYVFPAKLARGGHPTPTARAPLFAYAGEGYGVKRAHPAIVSRHVWKTANRETERGNALGGGADDDLEGSSRAVASGRPFEE
jgi:hypothetical protein